MRFQSILQDENIPFSNIYGKFYPPKFSLIRTLRLVPCAFRLVDDPFSYGIRFSHIFEIPSIPNEKPSISMENLVFWISIEEPGISNQNF